MIQPQSAPSSQSAIDHSWRYFELHANQRLTVFNFFVLFSGILTAGLAATLQGSERLALVGVAVGTLLCLLSWIFWKLDQRVSFLIKHAERSIGFIERGSLPKEAQLFSDEAAEFSKHLQSCSSWRSPWTYGRCLRVVFVVMAGVGGFGSLLALFRFLGWFSW